MQPVEENASPEIKALFDALKQKMGRVPNIFRVMANAPEMLKIFLLMQEGAEKTSLSRQTREKISLFISQFHGCSYCLAAHTHIGTMNKISDEEMIDARNGVSVNPQEQAMFDFIRLVLEQRGKIPATAYDQAIKAGITPQQIIEIIYMTALNTFTNYFNESLRPVIDFPEAPEI